MSKPELEKMIMKREKNRCTLTYYLFLQKSDKNQLSGDELETIEKEMAREKDIKQGVTLQSTAECISAVNDNQSVRDPGSVTKKRNKIVSKPGTVRNTEDSEDPSQLPPVISKKKAGHNPLRKVIKVNKPENSYQIDAHSPRGDGDFFGGIRSPAFQS